MQNLSRTLLNTLLLCALSVWGAGCDDAGSPGNSDTGTGGTGGDAAPDEGPGGTGGTGGVEGKPCFGDEECLADEYCAPQEAGLDRCEEGCRLDPDNCDEGTHCDETHACADDPCMQDEDCPDPTTYCRDPGDNGSCEPGCRTDDDCDLAETGHDQVCDTSVDPRICIPLIPCCGADACTMESACEGTPVAEALSCDLLRCDDRCDENGDEDCEPGFYCNDSDICQEGCRDDLDCPEDQVCNDKHECEEEECDDHADCPDTHFCDEDGTCHEGCRDDDACPGGECVEGVCVEERCGPDSPCPDGQHCNPDGACEDDCQGHVDCPEGEFCDPDGACIVGCRDDSWEENDSLEAFDGEDPPAFLEMPGANADGFSVLTVESANDEPTKLCTNPPEAVAADFYGVTLPQANRMRIELHFDENDGNLNLRLHGGDLMDPLVRDGLDNPEAIEYPDIGADNNADDYFIEVYADGDLGNEIPYELTVVMGEGACFPDRFDNHVPDDARPVEGRLLDERGLRICAGEEDWFRAALDAGNGIQAVVCTPAGSDPLQVRLYSADRVMRADFGNPNAEAGAGVEAGNEVCYTAEIAEGIIDQGGDWFVDVEGADRDAQADYRIRIEVFGDFECPPENDEEAGPNNGNDEVGGATNLDDIDEINDGGMLIADDPQLVPDGRAICLAGDIDWFCMTVGDNDRITAEVSCDDLAGQADVQVTDAGGNPIGQPGSCVGGGASAAASGQAAEGGVYCISVTGVAAAQGAYDLTVTRAPPADRICGADMDEPPRNDAPGNATEMAAVPDSDGTRFQHTTGFICDPDGMDGDHDWYSFPVASANSTVCVMLDGFDNAQSNLDMEVYIDEQLAGGMNCPCGAGEECIRGRCRTHRAGGAARGDRQDVEDVFLTRNVVGERNGGHLVKVFLGSRADEQPYTITASVIPDAEPGGECPEDVYEPNGANDMPAQLGDGEKALCDMWVCEAPDDDGRRDVDRYSITVPAGQDRTVAIEYLNMVEGRLFLQTENDSADPMDIFAGLRASQAAFGNFQCINIQSSVTPQDVVITVEANLIDPGDPGPYRVDYALRVVDTDLGEDPAGECERLGAPPQDACPDGQVIGDACWPTAILPD